MNQMVELDWQSVCEHSDLIPYSGVAAWLDGEQVAIFYLPGVEKEVFAVSNHDPIGKANVIARGIVGDVGGELVVASPLYKQHFSLLDGRCLEQPETALKSWPVRCQGNRVEIGVGR